MKEYIEREALLEEINEKIFDIGFNSPYQDEVGIMVSGMSRIRDSVEAAPAADVAPVVHGLWEDHHFIKADCPKGGFPSVRCSVCGITFCDLINVHRYMYHYCPNCGARMDGE